MTELGCGSISDARRSPIRAARPQENMQREVFRKRQEEEKAIDADVKASLAERATVHTARDGLRDAIRSSRGASKKEETDYYKHRKQVGSLGDAKSSLGDSKGSLGDAKSSLGDV